MTKEKRPLLAITMGDPAGIGPEITAKALTDEGVYRRSRPLVIGDAAVMRQALAVTGLQGVLDIRPVARPEEGLYTHGTLDVLDMGLMKPEGFAFGEVNAACGEAAYRYVEKAINLALAGEADATVTNPICKEAVQMAGHRYAGHTEIYAALTGTKRYCMLLIDGPMRVSHVSTHVSLRRACDLAKKERILEVIELTGEAVRRLTGKERPVIAVAGLNPHCGENGLFGDEEQTEIMPAVEEARRRGLDVQGPVPPDTLFSKLHGGWFDAAVAMYHDQGHIPLKVLGFTYDQQTQKWTSVSGVNITLGLPIIRTSVDHGTAFDQAGKGGASEISLINAISCAVQLAQ